MHEPINGPNHFPRGFKSLKASFDRRKDQKLGSLSSQKMLEDEVKRIQYEVDVLCNERSQLEIEMEERVQEANSLSSRIRDLEAQLSKENANTKRFNSKIKQFVRAHVHQCRLNDEIKRSQVQLEQLVVELGVDARQMGAGEDTSDVNVIRNEGVLYLKNNTSLAGKQLPNSMEATQGSKLEKMADHEVRFAGSRSNHFNGHGVVKMGNKRKQIARPSTENKQQSQNNASKSLDPLGKLKVSESNLVAPPTSMAAHADDDFELIDAEDNPGVVGTPKKVENGLPFLIPPLPAVPLNSYFQYEGHEENIDVDGVEELEEVDIV